MNLRYGELTLKYVSPLSFMGALWSFMELYGALWSFMELYGAL